MKNILLTSLICIAAYAGFGQTYKAYKVIYGEDLYGETIKKGEASTNEVFEFSTSKVVHKKLVETKVLTTSTYTVTEKGTRNDGAIYYKCKNDEDKNAYFMIYPNKKWVMYMEGITINKYFY